MPGRPSLYRCGCLAWLRAIRRMQFIFTCLLYTSLAILLKECPQIQGLTLRVHGESGIPEGSYPFWKTLFEAISGCGRRIEIDMHAKGVNQIMIDMASDTGMPVKLGAKYSAEHQSLGYNQADIRERCV